MIIVLVSTAKFTCEAGAGTELSAGISLAPRGMRSHRWLHGLLIYRATLTTIQMLDMADYRGWRILLDDILHFDVEWVKWRLNHEQVLVGASSDL